MKKRSVRLFTNHKKTNDTFSCKTYLYVFIEQTINKQSLIDFMVSESSPAKHRDIFKIYQKLYFIRCG